MDLKLKNSPKYGMIDQIGNFGVNQKNKLVLPLSNLLQIYSGQREIVGEEEAHNLNFLKRVGWG